MENISVHIGYYFKDEKIINLALTHKSYSDNNNERLEFLGDAILNLYVSEKLFLLYSNLGEGSLTRFKASIVSRENLNSVASKLKIGNFIKLGKGEKLEGNSILGNTIEAIIGAIFLDSDYVNTKQILDNIFEKDFLELKEGGEQKDSKSSLQELIQKKFNSLPNYTLEENSTNKDNERFHVTCSVDGSRFVTKGTGRTRKRAELEAASFMLKALEEHDS